MAVSQNKTQTALRRDYHKSRRSLEDLFTSNVIKAGLVDIPVIRILSGPLFHGFGKWPLREYSLTVTLIAEVPASVFPGAKDLVPMRNVAADKIDLVPELYAKVRHLKAIAEAHLLDTNYGPLDVYKNAIRDVVEVHVLVGIAHPKEETK